MKLPLSSSTNRRILTTLLAAISTAGLMQTSLAADATPSIPIIVKDTTSNYWQIVFAGARKAGKDLGVKVPEQGAQSESDINGQISILENAVSEKPAAIVISPPQEAVCLRKQHRRQPDGHRKTPFPLANIIETGTVE